MPERSSVGPTRGNYTSRTVVLEATPASIWSISDAAETLLPWLGRAPLRLCVTRLPSRQHRLKFFGPWNFVSVARAALDKSFARRQHTHPRVVRVWCAQRTDSVEACAEANAPAKAQHQAHRHAHHANQSGTASLGFGKSVRSRPTLHDHGVCPHRHICVLRG